MEGTQQNKVKGWTIITGATGSMGSVAVRKMAAEGWPVILACRNIERGRALMNEILKDQPDAILETISLDLASQSSVRDFAKALKGRRISSLFNNAGTMQRHYGLTVDGIEETMAVNYLNLALLTLLLLPEMEDGGRIVNMVSVSSKVVKLDLDWKLRGEKDFHQLWTYARSKYLLLYFSIGLAKHCPNLHVNVSDPGVVNSKMITMDRWYDPLADLFFRPFISSPEKGVQAALNALHSNDSLRYYVGRHSDLIPRRHREHPSVEKVWKMTLEDLKITM